MPINKKMFVIQHVEHESIFYQMGSLQTYDLRCELFEYSGERFDTGFPYLDDKFESDNLFIDSDGTTFNVEVRGSVFHMVDADARGDLIETPKLEQELRKLSYSIKSHSSNTNWPLRIYTNTFPNSGLELTDGVTITGTPGVDGKLTWTPKTAGTWYYINPLLIGMGDTIRR